jgi:hypothetical protein
MFHVFNSLNESHFRLPCFTFKEIQQYYSSERPEYLTAMEISKATCSGCVQ